jgi:hypothetical protein
MRKLRFAHAVVLGKCGNEIQVSGRKCVIVNTYANLSLAVGNIVEPGEWATNVFPIPIAVVLRKPHVEGQKLNF